MHKHHKPDGEVQFLLAELESCRELKGPSFIQRDWELIMHISSLNTNWNRLGTPKFNHSPAGTQVKICNRDQNCHSVQVFNVYGDSLTLALIRGPAVLGPSCHLWGFVLEPHFLMWDLMSPCFYVSDNNFAFVLWSFEESFLYSIAYISNISLELHASSRRPSTIYLIPGALSPAFIGATL